MTNKELVFCRKCRKFWERGVMDGEVGEIKWFKMLGSRIDLVNGDHLNLSGPATCPECDPYAWINRRSISSRPYCPICKTNQLLNGIPETEYFCVGCGNIVVIPSKKQEDVFIHKV